MPQPGSILLATQSMGVEFSPPGGWMVIHIDQHSGGTWTLQAKSPEQFGGADVWVDTDQEFDKSEQRAFLGSPSFAYRLDGGTIGARAWIAEADPNKGHRT